VGDRRRCSNLNRPRWWIIARCVRPERLSSVSPAGAIQVDPLRWTLAAK
jgi:hypothetical protein